MVVVPGGVGVGVGLSVFPFLQEVINSTAAARQHIFSTELFIQVNRNFGRITGLMFIIGA